MKEKRWRERVQGMKERGRTDRWKEKRKLISPQRERSSGDKKLQGGWNEATGTDRWLPPHKHEGVLELPPPSSHPQLLQAGVVPWRRLTKAANQQAPPNLH